MKFNIFSKKKKKDKGASIQATDFLNPRDGNLDDLKGDDNKSKNKKESSKEENKVSKKEQKKVQKKKKAEAKKAKKINVEPRLIMGYDHDPEAISIARYHAQQAGVEDIIHFQEKEFKDFSTNRKYGYIITNPPYGERMGEKEEVEELYKEMGEKFLELETWSYYIIASHSKFEKIFGKEASKRRKLYNGGVETQYYQYYGPWPPKN
jgi:23S rRNA G2445 N2-methylase RlmL